VTERTLVLVKPDAVQRGLTGEIIARIERKGLKLVAMDLRTIDAGLAEKHYAEHAGKPFFDSLVEFVTGGPLAGGTDPVEKAVPGSIRGDFALVTQYNLVHGSDSPESAAREIALWFPSLG